jgi:phospholipid/cholesterol/gamma-HCH transport system substrate-binding protein
MAQPKQLTWTELRVGLFVLVGLFIITLGVFYVTGAGFLGPKYRLFTFLPEVEGLQVGAPVRLDGVDVGNVDSIQLNQQPPDPMHNIRLVLRINRKFSEDIRTGSSASLITEGLLGNRYVTISRSLGGQPIPSGGEVQGSEKASMKEMAERGVELEENLKELSDSVATMVKDVQKGRGTVGKLLTDPALYNNLNATTERLQNLVADIQGGKGTVGKLVASDELYQKVNATMGNTQDLIAAVHDQKGTLGKLVYDPAAYTSAKQFLDNGNAVLADVRQGKGTIGKLANDDAVFNNMRDATANVRDATAKLNSNTGTMGKFFTDKQLYDNLTGATGDLRQLLGDFRQNPKKFLRIRVTIF